MSDGQGAKRCDFWLWDGSVEYEGALVRLDEGRFTAHVREAHRGRELQTGRRLPLPHVELQRRFLGRRFLSYFKDCSETTFEVEIESVQRSSTVDFDYYLCGRFRRTEAGKPNLPGTGAAQPGMDRTTGIWL